MEEKVHSTRDIIKNQFFFKKFTLCLYAYIWPYDVILTEKTALFGHFEQIFADLCLFDHYNPEFIS